MSCPGKLHNCAESSDENTVHLMVLSECKVDPNVSTSLCGSEEMRL